MAANEKRPLTEPELLGLARQGLNLAKREMERGDLSIVIGMYYHGEGLHHAKTLPHSIQKTLGKGWLDDGGRKDAAFSLLRFAVEQLPPDAVVIASASNMFKPTEKLLALPAQEQMARVQSSHNEQHQMAREGFFRVVDSIQCVAQDAVTVCHVMQAIEDGHFAGEIEVATVPQSAFGGRLKMYGDRSDFLKGLQSEDAWNAVSAFISRS